MNPIHSEYHPSDCIGGLRAAVPEVNDGVVLVASVVSGSTQATILLAGVAT